MIGKINGWLAGLCVMFGALSAVGPAFGQSATDQTAAEQTDTVAGAPLQEVVVTAERRAENVQTTPISVVAVSGAELQAESVVSINSLTTVAPDVTIQSGNGSSAINIRGIGIEPVGLSEAGVAVVRDGIINATPGAGTDMPFYDIADVEVLRGPQGTFAGDNSTGGAVLINSANPNFRGVNGYANFKVATYSDTAIQGAVNLPVTDTFAMRLAFNQEKRGSFFYDAGAATGGSNEEGPYLIPQTATCKAAIYSNYVTPSKDCASLAQSTKTTLDPGNVHAQDVRFGMLWKPTDNFQSLTKVELDSNHTDVLATQPNINTFAPLGAGQPCPAGHGTAPNCVALYTYPGYSGSPYVIDPFLLAEKYDEDIELYSEELRYTLPDGIVARFVAGDEESLQNQATDATADAVNNQGGIPNLSRTKYQLNGMELDLISPATGRFTWIAGVISTRLNDYPNSFSTATTAPYSPAAPSHTFWINGENITYKSEGAFGQISYQVLPTLQFQAGARLGWDYETAKGSQETYRPPPLTTLFSDGHANVYTDDAYPTGKVGFNWTPVQGQYFYVFWARGYKPGLGNVGGAALKGEHVTDYELGWKATMAGGHLQTDVGAYYMQYDDMIEQTFDPNNARSTGDSNLAPSSVKGIEASLRSKFGGFGFDISADYNRSKLGAVVTAENFAFPAGYGITNQCAPGVTPLPGNTNCTNYTPYLVTLSGEALPFSPLFQGTATLRYAFALGSMSVEPRVTYAYTDKQYTTLFQIPFYEEPAHGILNAYIDWIAGPYTVTLFATNVTNKLTVTNIAATSEYFGDPRQLGLQVNRSF